MSENISSEIRDIYTVTRLNREVRAVLEGSFPPLWVQGEISNLARPSSGHLYFSLKDHSSQVRCAMFKNRNQYLKFKPENGMAVILRANISLYEGRGEFQLIVDALEPEGIGALQLAFEQLKARLQAEGMFSEEKKLPVPKFPVSIGVITSPTGAAIRDILNVLKRRYPLARVVIYPVAVQGTGAADQINQTIINANHRNECDVIILARGGGSLEDLWSFNEEKVARAIFNSVIPIITGVGHEIDFTIADFVADKRAPTPSVAAELVSPDLKKLEESISAMKERLVFCINRKIYTYREHVHQFHKDILDPVNKIQNYSQRLDEFSSRIQRSITSSLNLKISAILKMRAEINQFNPILKLKMYREKCQFLDNQLIAAINRRLVMAGNRFERTSKTLQTVSPLATLERGYSIVTNAEDGKIVNDIQNIKPAIETKTEIRNGFFYSTIIRIQKK